MTCQRVTNITLGSSGFSDLAELTNNGASVQRIADNTIIRYSTSFVTSPDHWIVYVGSNNTIYPLDATDPSLPILMNTTPGTFPGTDDLVMNADGTHLNLSGGAIIDTATLL